MMNLNEYSCVRGYHVYQDTWTSVISEQLVAMQKRRQQSTQILSCMHGLNICTVPFYNLLSKGNYFTGKVSRLPTILQKLQNISTSNNLQYTVLASYIHTYIASFKRFECAFPDPLL